MFKYISLILFMLFFAYPIDGTAKNVFKVENYSRAIEVGVTNRIDINLFPSSLEFYNSQMATYKIEIRKNNENINTFKNKNISIFADKTILRDTAKIDFGDTTKFYINKYNISKYLNFIAAKIILFYFSIDLLKNYFGCSAGGISDLKK